MAALEALIYAVEEGRLPLKRIEDALARQRRVKERFLAPPRAAGDGAALRDRGRCAHQVARPRRAPGGRRRDGAAFASGEPAMRSRARCGPATASRVVAPASPFAREEFDAGVAELRRLGFEPVYDESVFARHALHRRRRRACAPRRSARAWRDPSIAALIAVRGGYGSVAAAAAARSRPRSRRTPKAFIGYSDNTSLLVWLTTGCGIVVVPRPDARAGSRRGERGYDRDTFTRVL